MKIKNVLLLFIGLAVMVTLSGCKTKSVSSNEALKNVRVVQAAKSDIILSDEYAGEVTSSEQVSVVPKVPGKVSAVYVDIGKKVNKGDLLFTLDAGELQAQLNQAQAAAEVAKVNLNRAKGSGYSQSLIQAQAAYDQAQIAYNDAKSSYDKMKALFSQGVVSQHDFESIENKMLVAKQQFDSASQNLELLKKGLGPDSENVAQGQLNQALASVQFIESQLSNTRVTAPISGIVSNRNINVGEGASMSVPSIIISNTEKLYADVEIPERLISKVKLGDKISVSIDSLNKNVDSIIDTADPVADERSHTYTIRLKLTGTTEDIKPGMFAKIRIPTDQKSGVLVVPNQAVITQNGIQSVFVVNNGVIQKKPVKIGLSNERLTEILEGINIGENVIFEGQSFLTDGERVNVMK